MDYIIYKMNSLSKIIVGINLYGLLLFNLVTTYKSDNYNKNYYLYSIKPTLYPIWKDLLISSKK